MLANFFFSYKYKFICIKRDEDLFFFGSTFCIFVVAVLMARWWIFISSATLLLLVSLATMVAVKFSHLFSRFVLAMHKRVSIL